MTSAKCGGGGIWLAALMEALRKRRPWCPCVQLDYTARWFPGELMFALLLQPPRSAYLSVQDRAAVSYRRTVCKLLSVF